jgi:hypothetical protein
VGTKPDLRTADDELQRPDQGLCGGADRIRTDDPLLAEDESAVSRTWTKIAKPQVRRQIR